MWKKTVVALFIILAQEGLRKPRKLGQDSRSPIRVSNQRTPEYEAGVITNQQRCPVCISLNVNHVDTCFAIKFNLPRSVLCFT
jgi:hypothetical protein